MTDVRPATPADLPLLPALERDSDAVFAELGILGLPAPAAVATYETAAAVLVAGSPPVGFARIELVAGEPYLDQLSVHPTAMRRGVGSSLLEAAVAWAADNGYDGIFLATFRDVVFNAPFYARHGFVEIAPTTEAHRQVAAHEQAIGMPRFGPRVLMQKTLAG